MAVTAADILLVDDDQDLHSAVEMMLAPLGYSVRACTTGSEGLEAMRRRKPDLVLLRPDQGLEYHLGDRSDQLKVTLVR